MAKIGLTHFRYSIATVNSSTGAITYAGATAPGKAVSFSMSVTKADAELYANDGLAESDYAVTGGDITLGLDRYDLTTMAAILGHDIADGEVTYSTSDVAPYVGLGRVVPMLVDNVRKWRGTVLALCKFSDPDESDTTRGETVEFGTYEIPGKLVIPAAGNYRFSEDFDTEAAAIAYIEGKLAAPTP
jgi:hypothetical protein